MNMIKTATEQGQYPTDSRILEFPALALVSLRAFAQRFRV